MRLSRGLLLYIGTTAAIAAVVLVIAWGRHPELPHGLQWYYTLILTALIVIARQFPLPVSRKTKIIADAPATIAAVVLLPAPFAITACVIGKAVGQIIARQHPVQNLFNSSVQAITAGLGVWVFSALGSASLPGYLGGNGAPFAGAAIVLWTANAALIEGIVSVQLRHPPFVPFRGWRSTHLMSIQHDSALFMLGAIAAAASGDHPWVLAALALPTAVFYRSLHDFQLASEAEARAEASRARLASIVEAGTDAVITTDPRGRLTDVSQVGRRLLALDAEEDVTVFTLEDVFPASDAISLRNEGIPSAARTGLWSSELTMIGRQGEEIPVAVIALAHRDASSEIASYSFVARNITERRRSESALRQTQKLESLGTLAGGIAHDFNNLLMAIMGFAGLLKRSSSLGEADRDRVLLIEEAARNGGDFTGRLLAFSRGGLAHIGPVDLRTVISDTLRLAEPTLQRRVTVSTSLPDQPVMVESDFTQLEQAILNIILNARDAMPDGGNLAIRLWSEDDYAFVAIKDNGIGMDEATRLRIFEPFYTTKPTGAGTGLGLAMTYGIVQGHRGQLTVESTPGVGSTFTIRLPALKAVDGSLPVLEDDALQPAILVVDDDEMVRRSLTATLSELGFHAIGVASGADAVAAIRANPSRFLAVLLDLVMPGMTGGETYRQINAIRSDLPVIVCTGYAADSQIDDEVKRRIAGLIQKPFSAEKLESVLRRIGVEPPVAPPEAVSLDESEDGSRSRPIRVVLVDDHDIVRQALRSLLEGQSHIEVAGDFDNARVALKSLKALDADVVLMDTVMPSLNGIDATRQFLQKCPELRIILLSGFVDEEQLRDAIRAGASGYVAKTADITELVEAIEAVNNGRTYFSHSIAERFKLPQIIKDAAKPATARHEILTPREREILQLIAEGFSSQDIVDELGLSMKTVEVHRYHLNKKLNAHTQSDLVRYAIRNGIVRLETPPASPRSKSGGVAAKRN